MTKKKKILLDLDGVLNTYDGSFDSNFIPPIKEGARDFVENLSKKYELKLFTARDKKLATDWILENKLEKYISEVTNQKELCWLFVDDRCVTFEGNYDFIMDKIENFNAWYKE